MTHHLELAQGSRRSTAAAGVPFGALFISGCEKLGETQPTKLLGVLGYTELNRSQFVRLSRELGESFPDLRGKQVTLLKDLCLVANRSEEFILSVSKDQWLRTAILCRKGPKALFSSKAIEQHCHTLISGITIHSNVVPCHPYWPKLQAVRDESAEVASQRVYFPSTFLEVALLEDKSLVEKLKEWEGLEDECAIVKEWHERCDDEVERTLRPFWKIGPDDVEVINSNFAHSGQADVWKISWRGGIFARKVFKHKDTFDTELEVVRRVSHTHIVYSFGVSMSTDEKQHSLLMELLDRDLFLLIEDRIRSVGRSKPPFSPLDSLDILMQVVKAMAHMHDLDEPVIHGDLKPKNILVSQCEILGDVCQYFVKVADFGCAKILRQNSSSTFYPEGGTTQYAAPEVLKAILEKTSINYPKKLDVYSFGIIAFQVLTGLEPYEKFPRLRVLKNLNGVPTLVPYEGVSSRPQLKKGVIEGTLRPPLEEACSRPNFWNDPDLVALIKNCWDPEPSTRPCFAEVAVRLESIHKNLSQKSTNGSNVHLKCPPSQVNAVNIAPQSDPTTGNGLPRPEVNELNNASNATQVCPLRVQGKPKRASRIRLFVDRHLSICISSGEPLSDINDIK